MTLHLSRRHILKGTGALVVGFSLARPGELLAQGAAAPKPLDPTLVDAFLAIDKNGVVTIYSGKIEMGTGISTALPQIVADELDVALDKIKFVQGDTALTPDQGPTFGSLTIQNGGMQLRQAAAAAREKLLDEAAKKLGADKANLSVANGVISDKNGKKASYGELIGGKGFDLKLDPKNPLKTKDPKDFKIVGQSIRRVDIPGKVFATFDYMQDMRVPGMLHGRVIRPPAMGAALQSVDESSIKDIPNVRVVREKNFLAVVAASEWNAIRAAKQLKAQWSKAETLPDQAKLWEHVRGTKVVNDQVTSNTGDTKKGMEDGKTLSATYDFAINLHGSIGPSCAIAEIKDGKLTCWTASQATHNLRKQLAQMMSMKDEDVRCIYHEGSGCYGRNGHEDAAGDAAILAKAVGKPVRVQWSRADEHAWEPMGPPTLADLRASIDSSGKVTAWESDFFIPQGAAGNCPLVGQELAGLPSTFVIAPGNIIHNSAVPYKFENVRTVCKRLETTPFRPSWIRTPGRMQNTYMNECFLDELAAAANIDPVDFRIRNLDDKRGIEVLERVAKLAKWEKRPSPQKNQSGNIVTGRGVTYVKYELVRTYVGAVADVEVDRTTGKVRVTNFYIAHDCGQIINPDGIRSQLDGNVIQTVSRTLMEEVKWDRAMVTTLDWASYPIIAFPDVPALHYDLIDRPNERPWGAGEPAAAVVPSAISNAIFDATGARVRSVPFTPAKVKAALGQGA